MQDVTAVDAFVPRNFNELLKAGKWSPHYIDFWEFDTPDSVGVMESRIFAKTHLHPAVFHHSVRVYYFSLALLLSGFPSGTEGVEQIPLSELKERLWHACLLHDMGTSKSAPSHSSHTMSFEFHGGFLAHYHLAALKPPLTPELIGDVVESIFMHTSTFDRGTCTALVRLLDLSTALDVTGWGSSAFEQLWDKRTVASIEKQFPRLGFGDVFADRMIHECSSKKGCIMTQRDFSAFEIRVRDLKSLVPDSRGEN